MPSVHTGQNGQPVAAASITSIAIERNCFGCVGSSVLVLQRDGSASYTVTGNARRGTEDKVSTGTLQRDDFDALAALVVSSGFFNLQDSYEDPGVQDGAWATISVTRSGQTGTNTPPKRVFRREESGPQALKAVETAIENLRARIPFKSERP